MEDDEVGTISVSFSANGNAQVKIDGKVNYMQIWGVAALLAEEARMQYAQQKMASMMGGAAGIIPGGGGLDPQKLRGD